MPRIQFVGLLLMVALSAPALRAQPCTPGPNTSIAFDGIDDILQVPDHPALDGFDDFTIELWVALARNTNQGLLSKFRHSSGLDTDDAFSLRLWPPGVLRIQLGAGTTNSGVQDGITTFADGAWHHVAVTRSGSTVTSYIDGLPDISFPFAGTLNATDTALVLGAVFNGADSPLIQMEGRLDEVRIWNLHRTQTDIQNTMGTGLTGTEPGLVGYWRMDDGTGQLVSDSGPNAVTGTFGVDGMTAADDPAWSPVFPSPLVYCGGIGGGQANAPGASLMINGVGLAPAAGPFIVPIPSSGAMEFVWQGPPGAPLAMLLGGINSGVPIPGVGSLDVGSPPFFGDLFFLFDGFTPPYNLIFSIGVDGTARQSFTLPPLPPVTLGWVQGLVGSTPGAPLNLSLTAAFQIDAF